MDLRLLEAEPTSTERAAVDEFLGDPRRDGAAAGRVVHGGRAARAERHRLLPTLHALHERAGWISPGALNYVAQRLTIPPADVYGVATFYALFSVAPQPPLVVHVCDDIVCRRAGAGELLARLEEEAGRPGEDHGGATWLASPCLGQCERAPAALVVRSGEAPHERALAPATPSDLFAALHGSPLPAAAVREPGAGVGGATRRLLRRVGVVDPVSLDDYRAHGGYEALRRALELGPDGVLRELSESKLVGRGGAAFPTARKWEAVARHPRRPHHLICNADESEPGTFKDRVLLEGDPFSVIEAMTIAALATGCEHGYVYLRGEYPLALARLASALDAARAHGFLGPDILGRGLRFDIEIRKGAGAYICGEETAIFGSIEGYRGEPRNKPPFPVDRGLFGGPTVVNNVETLVNVPWIVLEGGRAFAGTGTEKSSGTKLFCVSGAVASPGVYEVAFGTTLGELLALAGGVPADETLRTVLLGGAAGSFVAPDALDLALTFEDSRAAGATLGSGVVIAVSDRDDLDAMLRRIAAFFRDESCGQCAPCRVGTVRQEEALARLLADRPRGGVQVELGLIAEMGQAMRDASICGLGQTASAAIESAIRLGLIGGER